MNDNTGKSKCFRWAFTIGLIFGTALIVAFAFLYDKLPTIYKYEADALNTDVEQPNLLFSSVATTNQDSDLPYLNTDFDNVFFTASNEGTIEFWEFKNDAFSKLKSSGTINISVPLTNHSAEINVELLERDGQTVGYGVYVSGQSIQDPYAFFKLTENRCEPYNFDYLLYADYTIDDFYRNDKTFNMVYGVHKDGKKAEKLISDDHIRPGRKGLLDSSYILIPDSFTSAATDGIYFLSDRNYSIDAKYDVYKKTGLTDEEQIVFSGAVLPYLYMDKNTLYVFTKMIPDGKTEDLNSLSLETFSLISISEDEKFDAIKTFSGSPDQYFIKGNYIFSPSAKKLYSVESGRENIISTSISISGVQDFAVSSNGKKFALAGNFAGNSEKLFFYNFSSDRVQTIDGADVFFSGYPNLTFIDDSVYLLAPSQIPDKVINFVVSWNAIFSLN